jgi:quercetin dioxygenase-like cupin family protein
MIDGNFVMLLVAIFAFSPAFAQDPTVVNPATVHATLDNTHVRVLESVLKPGEREKMHSHPACVMYVVEGGKVRSHAADGTATEIEVATGATVYREPVTHWTENIGTTTIRIVLVELKN